MIPALSQTPPSWQVSKWFNTPHPLSLGALHSKVVLVEVFQMLCPGCVSHGLPQAQRIRAAFTESEVAVIGLHSVFEHHDAMEPHALDAFLQQYGIGFPVAVDMPDTNGRIPLTMRAYGLRGTPTLLVYDGAGRLCHEHFGQVEDLTIGAQVARLLMGDGTRDQATTSTNPHF